MGPRPFICSIVLLAVLHCAHSQDSIKEISKGGLVNFTATGEIDSADNLTWYFGNKIYKGGDSPPFVIFNQTTMQAYINTSDLSEEDYKSIAGIYTLDYGNGRKNMSIDVVLKEFKVGVTGGPMSTTTLYPTTAAPAGLKIWMYAIPAAVVVVIVIAVVVVIVIMRRRKKKASLSKSGEKTREEVSYTSVSKTEIN